MKNSQIFPSKVCHFQCDRRFLFTDKWETLERASRYICKNLLNLDCQDTIHFGPFQVA